MRRIWNLARRYSDWLRTGRSGDRIAVGESFSVPVQTGPGAHPASSTMGTGSFPRVESGRGVMLTPHPLLVPRTKQHRRVIPLLSLRAFVACKKGKTNQTHITTITTTYLKTFISVVSWVTRNTANLVNTVLILQHV
jgi:hypothetical protein